VGAGGKTTLMFVLARELCNNIGLVITTTTTKIFPPPPSDTPSLLISREEKEIIDFIYENVGKVGHVTIASESLADCGKLQGMSPLLVSKLIRLTPVNCIIVEETLESPKSSCRATNSPADLSADTCSWH